MIDGGIEQLEQEFMGYLLARPYTTPGEFAARFHLSDRSAAYWLGSLVRSGRVRIGRIECQLTEERADHHADRETRQQEEASDPLQAVLEVSALFGTTGGSHT